MRIEKVCEMRVFIISSYIFFIIYGLILVSGANFGVIDDHLLLETLLINKPMPYFIIPEIGRFFPLDAIEYSFTSWFSTSPTIFYSYNFFQLLVFVLFTQKLIVRCVPKANLKLVVLVVVLILFTPGFVTSWFRLFVPERNVLFFLTIFLYYFFLFTKSDKVVHGFIALASANIALYYKEPVFLLLGSFIIFYTLSTWRTSNFKQVFLNSLIFLSSCVFFAFYFILVYQHKGEYLYGFTSINPTLVMAKNIFNGCFADPVIVFMLLPLFFWRLYLLVRGVRRFNAFFDSLVFSSVVYVLVFFKLNMYAYHYLLPIYVFAIPAILYFFINDMLYRRKAFRFFGALSLLFILFSSLPTAIHLISYYKNVPNNFQKSLTFLVEYIQKESGNGKKVSLFIDGVNKGSGVEVYKSYIKNLEFRQLDSSKFNIKVTEVDDGMGTVSQVNNGSPYAVFSQTTPSQIHKGDLLIISPYSNRYVGLKKNEIKLMLSEYDVIFHADSFMEVPDLGIKSILKYGFMRANFSSENDKTMISKNVFQLPLDFYVLKKN